MPGHRLAPSASALFAFCWWGFATPGAVTAAPLSEFFSSDATHDARLNDQLRRQLRVDFADDSLRPTTYTSLVPAVGETLWKSYEVESLAWFDYSATNLPLEERPCYLRKLLSIPVARFG